MTTIPNWPLGILLILAAYGVGIMAFVAWVTIDDWRTNRKQDRYYRELCEWAIVLQCAGVE